MEWRFFYCCYWPDYEALNAFSYELSTQKHTFSYEHCRRLAGFLCCANRQKSRNDVIFVHHRTPRNHATFRSQHSDMHRTAHIRNDDISANRRNGKITYNRHTNDIHTQRIDAQRLRHNERETPRTIVQSINRNCNSRRLRNLQQQTSRNGHGRILRRNIRRAMQHRTRNTNRQRHTHNRIAHHRRQALPDLHPHARTRRITSHSPNKNRRTK